MIAKRFVVAGAFLTVVACGAVPSSNPTASETDPTLPLLSDLEVAEDASNVALAAAPQNQSGGFLSRLLGDGAGNAPAPIDANAVGGTEATAPETAVAAAPAQPGFLGRIFNAGGGSSSASTGQATNEIPPRTMMAFGQIGPTCGLSRREMGTKIAEGSGYAVYDTIPNSTAPRPHYITGFNDGCARQFTAALVLLGDIGTHEVVRYNRTRVDLAYSETDNAYEAIKTSFCRVGFGQPCGRRLDRLARRTTFVSAYERFGAGPVWAEFLLHDGTLAAADIEGD